jgi:hypothetical protein
MALSRVVSTKSNGQMVDSDDEEDEVQDLLTMIEELNSHADLTVKLTNQSRIYKILQQTPPEAKPKEESMLAQMNPAEISALAHEKIKSLVEESKKQLEALQSEKE